MDASFDLVDDEEFYKEFIFPGTGDVSLTQLCTINTQDLVPCPSEVASSDTNGRFAAPLRPDEIEQKKRYTIPKNTQSSNAWACTVWKEWAANRNTQPASILETGFPIPEDIGGFDSFQCMDYWLQRFVYEIQRKDGKPYPPDTLTQITSGLQRYLRNERSIHVNFFRTDNSMFAGFRQALNSRMRELTNQGVGFEKKQAEPVSKKDEKQFWETGVFSFDTSRGLSNAVFFYNGKVFGLRGGDEHIGLLAEQFELGYDHQNARKYIKFTPRIRKNAQGGLKQSNKSKAVMTPVYHYDQPENDISIYRLYDTYINLIPRIGQFYRKPLDGIRFSAGNIPQKDLKTMMKRFYNDAVINTDNRTISNHSGRVTLCSTLYNDRFNDKSVMSRSKHCSNAVRSYQREDFKLSDEICKSLEPEVPQKIKPELAEKKESLELSRTEPKKNSGLKTVEKEALSRQNLLTVSVPDCVTIVEIQKGDKKVIVEL